MILLILLSKKSHNIVTRARLRKFYARSMLNSVQKGKPSMGLAKETFFKFCNHFSQIPYSELHNDTLVVQYFCNAVHDKNYYCNKAFQLALEVTYVKRDFKRENVMAFFNEHFSLVNSVDKYDTSSTIDQGTLFTALQTRILSVQYPKWQLEVNQTPPSNVDWKTFSPERQAALNHQKTLTGNRFPDVTVNGTLYDYKFSKDFYAAKNQIYIMPESADGLHRFEIYLNHLADILGPNKNKIYYMSEEFCNITKNKLFSIREAWDHASSPQTKLEIIRSWNEFSLANVGQRPKTLGMPIYVFTKPYIPDTKVLESLKNVEIPEGDLTQIRAEQAMRAIMGDNPSMLRGFYAVSIRKSPGISTCDNQHGVTKDHVIYDDVD